MLTTEQEVNIKKLATMIRVIKVAMLTTLGPDGILRCRPMATQEAEFDGSPVLSGSSHMLGRRRRARSGRIRKLTPATLLWRNIITYR